MGQINIPTFKLFKFYRDLHEAAELNLRKEKQKSEKLTRHCKTILLPDRLAEAVDRRVKYVAK